MSTQTPIVGESKSLLQKLENFKEFPQFWEEEDPSLDTIDPRLKAAQDKEVEEFRIRLEEMNQNRGSSRIHIEQKTLTKLKEFCTQARRGRYDLSDQQTQP